MKEILILMILNYFNGLYINDQNKALKYIDILIEESEKQNIDPLVTATNIRYESGWRSRAIGQKREIGLGQIKTNNKRLRKQLINSPRLQIKYAVSIMRDKIDQCGGDLIKAFNAYRSGDCKKTRKAVMRYKYYLMYRQIYDKQKKDIEY